MATDILIVGAGVFGLSIALAAKNRGLSTVVIEANNPGAGASGGIVGALTPHSPTRWRPMMAFQYAALQSLEAHAQNLRAATGIDTGYGRIGRITPLGDERARSKAEADCQAAPGVWGDDLMTVQDTVPELYSMWIGPAAATHGVQIDKVSARIAPRAYLGALQRAVGSRIKTGIRAVQTLSDGAIETSGGKMKADNVVVAAGASGWDLMRDDLRGSGVKGQAALLACDAPNLPVVYQSGLYIVPHANGTVTVGSTSEQEWSSPNATDAKLDALLDRARAASPAIGSARVIERWAGVRPRPPGREPLVGPVPGARRLWVAGGGYKIGFGIAHLVGETLAAMIAGERPDVPLPASFLPENRAEQLPKSHRQSG